MTIGETRSPQDGPTGTSGSLRALVAERVTILKEALVIARAQWRAAGDRAKAELASAMADEAAGQGGTPTGVAFGFFMQRSEGSASDNVRRLSVAASALDTALEICPEDADVGKTGQILTAAMVARSGAMSDDVDAALAQATRAELRRRDEQEARMRVLERAVATATSVWDHDMRKADAKALIACRDHGVGLGRRDADGTWTITLVDGGIHAADPFAYIRLPSDLAPAPAGTTMVA